MYMYNLLLGIGSPDYGGQDPEKPVMAVLLQV